MKFIDTHCHFDFPPFEGDISGSLARAAEAGVEKIIVPAIDASRFERVCALAAAQPALYAALGLHPIVIENHQEAHLDQLETLLQQRPRKLVAIGEIGLDLYRDDPQFDKQQRFLEAQLKLAKAYQLPVILHSRRTHDKLAQILRRYDLPRRGVVHGFAGSRRMPLLSWVMRLASAGPLPMNAPAKPVRPWRSCRSLRCCWKPMHPICRCRAFRASLIVRSGRVRCGRCSAACVKSHLRRLPMRCGTTVSSYFSSTPLSRRCATDPPRLTRPAAFALKCDNSNIAPAGV